MGNSDVRAKHGKGWTDALLGVRLQTRVAAIILTTGFFLIALLPLYWIVVSSTKNETELYTSFGLWFHGPFFLLNNMRSLFSYGAGVFGHWLLNTIFYTGVGGGGAMVISALAGYALSRYSFGGKKVIFASIIGSLLVPMTALTIPIYILYSKIGFVNSAFGMIIPSLVSPIGVYLMRVYIDGSVPHEIIDAGRVDGAGELLIFTRIASPLMVPGAVTVLLLSVVATWNNYFLPYIIFSKEALYPLTVGLSLWASQATAGGSAEQLYPLVVTGGVVGLAPPMILFAVLQRYWRVGLLSGALSS